MKSLEILQTDFHTGWGGQASRVLMLSAELARRGHRVTIAAPPGELARRARAAGLTVDDRFSFRAPGHAASFVADVRLMKRLLARRRFDVVDVHGSQDTWVTSLARLLARQPASLIMTRHNTKRVRTGWPNRVLYGRLIDHLILVDESVRRGYETFLTAGILEERRISVIPSAYRADLFHAGVDGRRIREELGLAEEALVVGVAGRLVTDKGHVHLMKAAAMLRPELPGMVLVFAGAGPEEERLKRQAGEMGLSGMVRFLGFRPDIAEVEAAFDIAVLPSVGCDASSASIKEAMALGVPIVASDIGGARHLIEPGVTGVVVRPGAAAELASAIRMLAADPAAAGRMAAAAREQVARRFSIGRLADETLAVYATTIRQHGAGQTCRAGQAGQTA